MKANGIELGNECAICGTSGNLEVHHIVPISKGGSNEEENLAVLCPRCNQKISNKVIAIIDNQFKITQFGGDGKRRIQLERKNIGDEVSIKIMRETREKLKTLGIKGETYDAILYRLFPEEPEEEEDVED